MINACKKTEPYESRGSPNFPDPATVRVARSLSKLAAFPLLWQMLQDSCHEGSVELHPACCAYAGCVSEEVFEFESWSRRREFPRDEDKCEVPQ